jgi:hypothetical protein
MTSLKYAFQIWPYEPILNKADNNNIYFLASSSWFCPYVIMFWNIKITEKLFTYLSQVTDKLSHNVSSMPHQ